MRRHTESVPADPADAQPQDTAAGFVALVELLIEGYPLMVTEWIRLPERWRPADAQRMTENQMYAA